MEKCFRPSPGAQGWQLSNAPVFSMAVHKAALDIFDEAGMIALGKKRDLMSGYLFFLLEKLSDQIEILTPADPMERGCQVSIRIPGKGKEIFQTKVQR